MKTIAFSLLLLLASVRASAAVSGSVHRGGVDIYYTVVGERGPYVMILSGGPGEEISSMQEVADHLSPKYRCIMLEQRGTGRSRVPAYDASTINLDAYIEDIEAVRKQLDAGRILVVGNSWGMMLALAYGGSHPDAVMGIATLGSGPITRDYLQVFVDNQQSRLTPCDREVIELWSDPSQVAKSPERAAFERIRATAPAYFYDRKTALRYAATLEPADFHPQVLGAYVSGAGNFDLRPKLRAITAPVLLLQGRQDLAGEANLYEAHLLIAGSVLRFIDKCGHIPWLEQPAETWRITDEFLAGLR
jgi:proline iminopeptidase